MGHATNGPTVPVPTSSVSCFLRATKPHPKASQRACSGRPVRSQRLVSPVPQRALLELGADNNLPEKRWGRPIPILRRHLACTEDIDTLYHDLADAHAGSVLRLPSGGCLQPGQHRWRRPDCEDRLRVD